MECKRKLQNFEMYKNNSFFFINYPTIIEADREGEYSYWLSLLGYT